MSVDLQIYDLNDNKIDLNDGINLGVARLNNEKVYGIKIKNEGTKLAKNASIIADIFGENLSDDELKKQQNAIRWKSYSFYENEGFKNELFLGDIEPGKYVNGTRNDYINFSTESKNIWKNVWENGITKYNSDTHIFCKPNDTNIGIMSKRMNIDILSQCRDFEVEMNLDFVFTTNGQSSTLPFCAFPVRVNSKGDGKGYMFMVQFRRNDSKIKITIYKDAKGMVSYEDRVYGIPLFDSITWQNFDKNKKIGFKIYNEMAKPTFEVKIDGNNILLGKVSDSSVNGYKMSDLATSAYLNKGYLYWDMSLYDGDYSINTSNMILKTEELEQPVYIKTLVDDKAINRVEYITSTSISYEE